MHHSGPCLGVVDCWRSGQSSVSGEMVVYNSAAVFDGPVGTSRLEEIPVIYETFFHICFSLTSESVSLW